MLVIPLGVVGAVWRRPLRGLFNDIYFQVGLLTTIGLSAKNAILIVEFAVDAEKRGATACDAAMEAARLRLRPILMTSSPSSPASSPLALAHRRGRRQPERHRHRRDRRHADRHRAGDLLRAGVLPAGQTRLQHHK